jgi:uncharacterized repeat protein (TIGR02543 family)
MKKIVCLILAATVALGAIVSCGKKDVYYVVTFNSEGGSAVTSKFVHEGSTMSRPDDPARSGHTFTGWYTDSDVMWNFATDVVRSHMTLHAHWIPNEVLDQAFLTALVAASEGLGAADYTPDSWAVFQTAMSEAKAVLANTAATDEQIVAAIEKLRSAIAGLVHV